MSRHSDLIKRLHDKAFQYSSDPILTEAAQALKSEVEAHEKTRESRNAGTDQNLRLRGQVRGLEALAARLREDMYKQAEDMRHRSQNESERYAAGYADGRKSVIEAIGDLFHSMERS